MTVMRILIVDPHEGSRTALAALLNADGHEVIATGSWITAQRIACERPCDIVISELSLPDRMELELTTSLADRYGTVGIVLTGYEEQLAGGWRRAGFSSYLYKPVGFQQVQLAIAKATADRPVGAGFAPEDFAEQELCWN